jgi:precorrin-8X/cobalt-precorrin-8 methylmutase
VLAFFDAYVVVDWSASNVPCSGRDSIWIAVLERRPRVRLRLTNPTTRAEAHESLHATLTGLVARGARYSFWAGMGMAYGAEALRILRAFDHWAAERLPLILAGALLALLVGLVVARRRRASADVGGVS